MVRSEMKRLLNYNECKMAINVHRMQNFIGGFVKKKKKTNFIALRFLFQRAVLL
jgi:hypothetical protein